MFSIIQTQEANTTADEVVREGAERTETSKLDTVLAELAKLNLAVSSLQSTVVSKVDLDQLQLDVQNDVANQVAQAVTPVQEELTKLSLRTKKLEDERGNSGA